MTRVRASDAAGDAASRRSDLPSHAGATRLVRFAEHRLRTDVLSPHVLGAQAVFTLLTLLAAFGGFDFLVSGAADVARGGPDPVALSSWTPRHATARLVADAAVVVHNPLYKLGLLATYSQVAAPADRLQFVYRSGGQRHRVVVGLVGVVIFRV